MRLKPFFVLAAVAALSACATPSMSGGQDLTLGPVGERVQVSVYPSLKAGPAYAPASRTLVVVLHGDAPILRPAYHYEFAAKIARDLPGVIGAGVLRPGYADPMGRRSDPAPNARLGDNYTPEVSARVAASIRELKSRYHPEKTILVGHSGGGAVAANLAEAYPDLIQGIIVASCPCDLAAWREKMKRFGRKNAHQHSLSPLENIAQLPFTLPMVIMVGEKDNVVGVENSQTFYRDGVNAGAWVRLEIVPGAGHMMLGDPEVEKVVWQLITG